MEISIQISITFILYPTLNLNFIRAFFILDNVTQKSYNYNITSFYFFNFDVTQKGDSMDTKKIAELIDKERRLQFDQQSKYMDTLGLPRQNYAAIMKRLKKDNSQVSFNLINALLKPLGYRLDIVKTT